MPVEIESFTTEVSLVDPQARLGGPQVEALIQEILRRLERQQREARRAERGNSFEALARGRR